MRLLHSCALLPRAPLTRLPLILLLLASVACQAVADGQTRLFLGRSHSSMPVSSNSSPLQSCRTETHPGDNIYLTVSCPEEVTFLDLTSSERWSYSSKSGFQGRRFLFAVESSKL